MLRAFRTAALAGVLAAGTLLGLSGSPAQAAETGGTPLVQTVQYYGPPPYAYGRPYYARPYPRQYARRHWGPPPRYYGRPYGGRGYGHHGRW